MNKVDSSNGDRFQRARRAFEAFAECPHGSFSLYCKHCLDPNNIFESRTRTGKFKDSIAELERAGLLDSIEVYKPERKVHEPLTIRRLAKIGALLIGGVLVFETLRRKGDLKGIVLHFFQKEKKPQ